MFERAPIDAAHRRHVGVIAAMPNLHIAAINLTVVRGVKRAPARCRE